MRVSSAGGVGKNRVSQPISGFVMMVGPSGVIHTAVLDVASW